MTMALCLNCGETKFGAICPCPKCMVSSSGDMQLDIVFSDHHVAITTLKGLGQVIQSIREISDDDQSRFWAFIHYVATRHPDLLGVRMPEEEQQRYEELVTLANPPDVIFEASERATFMRQFEERESTD